LPAPQPPEVDPVPLAVDREIRRHALDLLDRYDIDADTEPSPDPPEPEIDVGVGSGSDRGQTR
jgi:hypothetical protein